MLDRDIAKRPIDHTVEGQSFEPQPRAQQFGIDQPRLDREPVEQVARQIDPPAAVGLDPRAVDPDAARDHRLEEGSRRAEVKRFAQRALRQSGGQQRALRAPEQRIMPGAVGQAKRGSLLAGAVEQQTAVPLGPRALARDDGADVSIGADQSGEQAPARRGVIERDVELVAVGRGVDQRGKLVPAAQAAIGLDQRAARANIDLGGQIDLARGPGDTFGNGQLVDHEAVDADIEIGEHRRVGITRAQVRKPRQQAAMRHQRAHIQPAAEPVERPPVEIHQRHAQEHALRIGESHIVERRRAIKRAVDPPDADAQTRGGGEPGDAVDDQPVADPAVEHRNADPDQRGQRQQRGEDELAPARHAPFGQRDFILGHQNACPSATYTAMRLSPGRRLSGTPTSTRIGPNPVR